jgi:predicted NBD/HSP70 family sugar kinase
MKQPDFDRVAPAIATPLTEFAPIPMDPNQLELINLNTIRPREIGSFNVLDALQNLRKQEGRSFIGGDIGGDTITTQLFRVEQGLAVPVSGFGLELKSNDGEGYLAVLEETDRAATELGVPVSISYAGPTDDTRVVDGPNVKIFMSELAAKYDSDFSRVLSTLNGLDNDAVAGLTESAVNLTNTNPDIKNVIYLINGSGLGGAVLLDGTMIATEIGHTRVVERFNQSQRQKACGMDGAEFTCIENIAASKAGIEAIWLSRTGEALDGRGIEDRYRGGDQLAAELYDNSAQLAAHALFGLAQSFDIDLNAPSTAVVGHGGAFKFPGYADRVRQLLAFNTDSDTVPLVTTTYSFSPNACLDGAATLAAIRS